MEDMKNLYEMRKTIRMGLTLSDSDENKKNEKSKSHQRMVDLINSSKDNVKGGIVKEGEFSESEMVKNVGDCLERIKKFYDGWEKVFRRVDQIAVDKDFYRRLARKCNFEPFWEVGGKKQPQSSEIKLSSLGTKYENKERKEYILNYWKQNIYRTGKMISEFEPILENYNSAVKNENHKKPRLIDFRKMFLSIVNMCNEILVPLNNYSVNFPSVGNLETENNRNKGVVEFCGEESQDKRFSLADSIEKLRDFFKKNGGNAFWGRVTLNPYTAEQKPQNYGKQEENPIKKSIEDLKVVELAKELKGKGSVDIRSYFLGGDCKEKLGIMNPKDENISLIKKVQVFKSKPIKASVQFPLAEYLARNYCLEISDVKNLFRKLGKPIDINKEYKDSPNDFNLHNYPIKKSFDYAWENLARKKWHGNMEFNEEECNKFLFDNFEVDIDNNEDFELYSNLSFMKENLATIEHNNPNEEKREKCKENVGKAFGKIDDSKLNGEQRKAKETILSWVDRNKEEQKKLKDENKEEFKDYQKAKQKLGQLRGSQKNKVGEYKKLTETFKDLSMKYGRKLADLRDKFREEHEINKISHFGFIIEDELGENKIDRYVLIKEIGDSLDWEIHNNIAGEKKDENDLKTYYVKSLTSKTLQKLVKNCGRYKEFCNKGFDVKKIRDSWSSYRDSERFLKLLKESLTNSKMAEKQEWDEFSFDFSNCNTYEEIEREVDRKGHMLKEGYVSFEKIKELVEKEKFLLFPFVNQDITSKKREDKNQFSKDWRLIFEKDNSFRLHPEFQILYRQPTPDYPAGKRYSRFQMIAGLGCEIVPQNVDYKDKKEQLNLFRNQEDLEKEIDEFNKKCVFDDYFIFGIDRGERKLATLCVLDMEGKINGDFDIYTREFNEGKKQWEHSLLEKRNVLDLSNLRVETTIDGKKVLVDLSKIKVNKVRNNKGELKENEQVVKLKQLAYRRKLQYQMQDSENRDRILDVAKQDRGKQVEGIKDFISPFGVGKSYEDLEHDGLFDLLDRLKEIEENGSLIKEQRDKEIKRLVELDVADNLKRGVVANMIGVVSYLLEKYDYRVYISIENLSRAWANSTDGLNGVILDKSFRDNSVENNMDYKKQANSKLAGLGTYHYFEIQLLRKLFRIQKGKEVLSLVPPFRSVENYEDIRKLTKTENKDEGVEYTCKRFGVVNFVDPKNTSKKCPKCEKTKSFRRNIRKTINDVEKEDLIECKDCKYKSWEDDEDLSNNINYIQNGDDNAAYHIALKTLRNQSD